MASTQHYLALRPCIELLSVGDTMAQSIGGKIFAINTFSRKIFGKVGLKGEMPG